jgi:hypothetical protein
MITRVTVQASAADDDGQLLLRNTRTRCAAAGVGACYGAAHLVCELCSSRFLPELSVKRLHPPGMSA